MGSRRKRNPIKRYLYWKPGLSMKQLKANALYECLDFHDGNKHAAARDLKISVRSIRMWCADHKLLKRFYNENNFSTSSMQRHTS